MIDSRSNGNIYFDVDLAGFSCFILDSGLVRLRARLGHWGREKGEVDLNYLDPDQDGLSSFECSGPSAFAFRSSHLRFHTWVSYLASLGLFAKVNPHLRFKGDDTSFGGFPERLKHLLSHSVHSLQVDCVVFPAYEACRF